jgi:hypothetical protein
MEENERFLGRLSTSEAQRPAGCSISDHREMRSTTRRHCFDLRLWFRVREIAEDLDQPKAFAHEPHVFAEPSETAEIGPMCITPISQTPVAFALVVCEGGIDLVETPMAENVVKLARAGDGVDDVADAMWLASGKFPTADTGHPGGCTKSGNTGSGGPSRRLPGGWRPRVSRFDAFAVKTVPAETAAQAFQ